MQNPQPLQAQCKAICLGPTRTHSITQSDCGRPPINRHMSKIKLLTGLYMCVRLMSYCCNVLGLVLN